MALVVGSVAMNYWFNNFREPKDFDYFGKTEPRFLTVSWDKVEGFWHPAFEGTQLDRSDVASIDELYTIKVSHSYWVVNSAANWQKHMADILFLKSRGALLDMELHKLLYPVWEQKHGKKKMNLQQESDTFFKDAVVRIYDHDSIHRSVAFGDAPLYERILKDGESVDIDPDKMWNGLTFDNQIRLFKEEIAATALERWILNGTGVSPGKAYHMALRKTITSLTRGKSARFIVTNFEHFAKPYDYMAIHRAKSHLLLPLDPSKKNMM